MVDNGLGATKEPGDVSYVFLHFQWPTSTQLSQLNESIVISILLKQSKFACVVPLNPVEVYVVPAIVIACKTGVYCPAGKGGALLDVNGWVTVYVV